MKSKYSNQKNLKIIDASNIDNSSIRFKVKCLVRIPPATDNYDFIIKKQLDNET